MSTYALTTPNDACRAGCDLALRMVALTSDWQHEWHALAGRRIERDRAAVRHLQQALADTNEWTALGEATRQAMRDYAIASVAIGLHAHSSGDVPARVPAAGFGAAPGSYVLET